MPELAEMENFETMSRADLVELLKLYAQLLLTVDGRWFIGMEKTTDQDTAIKFDEQVWRQFGAIEAKLLKKFLGLETVTTLEDIRRIVDISPMWVSVEPNSETLADRCHLSVTNCHPQKNRLKYGMEKIPCKSMGTAYFEGFAKTLNPDLNFSCLFCPPDEHPEDVWCKWEIGWF